MTLNLDKIAVTVLILLSSIHLNAKPLALVYEYVDAFTNSSGAAQALRAAGFEVREETAFATLDTRGVDLIVFGSFLSEKPGYSAFVQNGKTSILDAVDGGAVFFQFTAAGKTEPAQVLLPTGLSIARTNDEFLDIFALQPRHLLLEGIPLSGTNSQLRLPFQFNHAPSWNTLHMQRGFGVVLSSDTLGTGPVMVEGSHGRGRIIFTSLALDKQYRNGERIAATEYQELSRLFFLNLLRYVEATRTGVVPKVAVTPSTDVATSGSWSLILLPDTQNYVYWKDQTSNAQYFQAQTDWIVKQHVPLDIRFVIHLGDVTAINDTREWKLARDIMGVLDGQVPYSLVSGNHDFNGNGAAFDRGTHFSEYFPPADFQALPSFGGVMEAGVMDNSFHLFEAGGEKWLVLGLEWSPRDKTLIWAGQVAAAYSDRRIIVVTHAYLYNDDTRYDWAKRRDQAGSPHDVQYGTSRDPEGCNDGEEIWQKLVSQNPNIVLVVNGHVQGDMIGFLSSAGSQGRTVHQMLINFQDRPHGGEGYLRILEVAPDQRTVRVRDYSPALGRFLLGSSSNFGFVMEGNPVVSDKSVVFSPNQSHEVSVDSTVVLAPDIATRSTARSFQWLRNGSPIPGATTTVLHISRVSSAQTGNYNLNGIANNGVISTWTAGVAIGTGASRLANVSVRSWLGGPGEQLVLGFFNGARTAVPMLIRAIGPSLERFGLRSFVRDPRLVVFNNNGLAIGANDDWEQLDPIRVVDASVRVGAAALDNASKDAAIVLDISPGAYTAVCSAANGDKGVALIELFQPGDNTASRSSVFRNFSVRARTSDGEGALTLGFVIDGSTSRTLLIRGVGPGLKSYGIEDAAGDPVLSLFDRTGRQIGANDDWAESDDVFSLRNYFRQVGAFDLSYGSRDAVLVTTLSPGAYTIRCAGKNQSGEIVLVEVYDLN